MSVLVLIRSPRPESVKMECKLQAPSSKSESLLSNLVTVFVAAFSTLHLLFSSLHFVLVEMHASPSRINFKNVSSNFRNLINPLRIDAWMNLVSEIRKFVASLRFCKSSLGVFRLIAVADHQM